VYGRQRLGAFWGHLAGWGFVIGKTASCAAMALTVGAYAAPSWKRPIAVAAVIGLTAVNYHGVRRTVAVTRVIVVVVLAALALVIVGTAFGGHASPANFGELTGHGAYGILQSAGLLFFAFAGYARIATLGEEVDDPAHTIPKAIPRALAITLAVYALVAISALAAVGPAALARSATPLATAVAAGRLDSMAPLVRVGGAIAAIGVLLSLIAGVSRTAFAMADDGELPRWLAAVHPRHEVPHRADVVIGGLVAVLVSLTDLRHAVGFSSFCVLVYYAIANAAAWTLPPEQRRWPRALAGAGFVGCLTLACTLPARTALIGACVLAIGAAIRAIRLAFPSSQRLPRTQRGTR
jgi:APA family basic amino acid/polyamine antiporter